VQKYIERECVFVDIPQTSDLETHARHENLQNNVMFELRIKAFPKQPMFEIKSDARPCTTTRKLSNLPSNYGTAV